MSLINHWNFFNKAQSMFIAKTHLGVFSEFLILKNEIRYT